MAFPLLSIIIVVCSIVAAVGVGLFAFFAMSASAGSPGYEFSVDFFTAVTETKKNDNVVVSPISIQIALAMLYAGARGESRNQLAKALRLNPYNDSELESYRGLIASLQDPVLKIASAAFVDRQLVVIDAYSNTLTSIFGAGVERVDFRDTNTAAKTINDWCAKNTNDKIKEIFKADALTNAKAVLANAVYFKASWKYKFDPQSTSNENFYAPSGTVTVRMMHLTETFRYSRNEDIKAQVLELPYAGDKFRMVIILPFENSNLGEVSTLLKKTPLPEVLKSMYSTEVVVSIPKFKLELEFDLESALGKMGITDIFYEQKANLSGVSPTPLFVSKVKQKVFIEVNEEGTEAAAVTGLVSAARSLSLSEENFTADRPFLYFVLPLEQHTAVFQSAVYKLQPTQPSTPTI